MTKESKWTIIMSMMFTIGIIAGCLYCVFVGNNAEMYEYLHDFISGIKEGTDKILVCRKSFVSGIKIIGLFSVCAMMKYGIVPICGITIIKSFSVGFTFAALFKYFGKKGIWIMLSQISSNILLFIIIVFFGALCSKTGFMKKEKRILVKMMAAFLASCAGVAISAFISGYVDVYILNLVAEKLY